jgi:serine protease DegQ
MRWLLVALMMATATVFTATPWRKWVPQRITQDDIDAAVLQALTTKPMPSPAAKAYADVMGSVVRVIGMNDDKDKPVAKATQAPPTPERTDKDKRQPKADDGDAKDPDDKNSVGTGVVIMDNGTILTNMHVVAGAKRIKVEFADGLVADADVINVRPEHDLAVLRARKIPDDLKAATMRSTQDLRPGDRVTAVGFPFGIGPSVSHGVVSGLKREFRSPEGNRVLTNLIQFDAAANPGNSGGPLVTDNGEVVGIVTAIYNPTPGRFFVGLGFAVPIENAAQAAGMPPF